jgi:hypothetical protein
MYLSNEHTSGTCILVRFAKYIPDISAEGPFSHREIEFVSEIEHFSQYESSASAGFSDVLWGSIAGSIHKFSKVGSRISNIDGLVYTQLGKAVLHNVCGGLGISAT